MPSPIYVDPQSVHTPTVGGFPPASWANLVRGDLEHLVRPPMTIGQFDEASPLTVPDTTITAVPFEETDAHDTDGMHSPSSNPTRFTCATGLGGWYYCEGQVQYETDPALEGTSLEMWYRVNGSTAYLVDQRIGLDKRTVMIGSYTVQLAAGDYVEVILGHQAGADLSIISGSFQLRKVSAL